MWRAQPYRILLLAMVVNEDNKSTLRNRMSFLVPMLRVRLGFLFLSNWGWWKS